MNRAAASRPARPNYPPFQEPLFPPRELESRKHWVGWRKRWSEKKGKPDKLPVCVEKALKALKDPKKKPGWEMIDWTEPVNHVGYDEAVAAVTPLGLDGIGFVLVEGGGIVGGDLDGCRNPETGEIEPWAQAIVDLNETYCAVSPSGQGLRFWMLSEIKGAITHTPSGVELYGSGRFLTFTGQWVKGAPFDVRPAPRTIAAMIARAEEGKRAEANKAGQEGAAKAPGGPQAAFDGDPDGDGGAEAFRRHAYHATFFGRINEMALEPDNLGKWVPQLFPTAIFQKGTGAWRVSSADLGRDLEEDLSISPQGSKDFGVHDLDDPREGKRTAIDLVIEWGLELEGLDEPEALEAALDNPENAKLAALRLAGWLGIDENRLKAMGWRGGPEAEADPAGSVEPEDLWPNATPPVLPAGLLPKRIETFAQASAIIIGADVGGFAMAGLAACAAAIPDKITLRTMRHEHWLESARIWVAEVGDPSTKKTAILAAASSRLRKEDQRRYRDYLAKKALWDALPKAVKTARPAPAPACLILSDTTVEAAQEVYKTSVDGVLGFYDELSGWFGQMDRYGSNGRAASDRGFWLQTYNGGSYIYNRIERGSAILPNISMTLLGGIQPDLIRKVANACADDGLIQRLMPVMLGPSTPTVDDPQAAAQTLDFDDLIDGLLALRLMGNVRLRFDDGAQKIRNELEVEHHGLAQAYERFNNKKLGTAFIKQDGIFARLCIVWHCVENVAPAAGSWPPGWGSDEQAALPEIVTEDTARRVAAFMRQFTRKHLVAFYTGALDLSDEHERLTAIADYILARKLDIVTNRDVQAAVRSMRKLASKDITPILEHLEALGWLFRIPPRRAGAPPAWKVNPAVHACFAGRGVEEARRREEARERIDKRVAVRRKEGAGQEGG